MTEYKLINEVKNIDPDEINKPKIEYDDFEVMVEGKKTVIGIPTREAEKFFEIIKEDVFFTRRKFRTVMREFRGVRK